MANGRNFEYSITRDGTWIHQKPNARSGFFENDVISAFGLVIIRLIFIYSSATIISPFRSHVMRDTTSETCRLYNVRINNAS